MATTSKEPTLYIWGAQWGLPSSDPTCLATLMFIQRLLPGEFSVVECNNPDLSPTGQLPFLAHEQQVLAGLRPIVKYVTELASKNGQRGSSEFAVLPATEKAQQVAWLAHAETHLGDLVYYSLFSHLENWYGLTHPTLISLFPVPHRYYMPGRIRESYRPRLEVAGLWNVHKEETKEKSLFKTKSKVEEKEEHNKTFQQAFGREKILEKAKETLDVYVELLGSNNYIFEQGPSILDLVIAAHVLLLSKPKYPDPVVQGLLKSAYSPLVSHSQRILSEMIPQSAEPIQIMKEEPSFWQALVPRITKSSKAPEKVTPEDAHFARMRWGFLGLTIGSLAVYLLTNAQMLQAQLDAQRSAIEEKNRQQEVDEKEEEEED